MDKKTDEFRQVLARKKRQLLLTRHAEMRAVERDLEHRLIQTDLIKGRITSVREQHSENPDERNFDVQVIGTDGQPMRYVLAINNIIRVITLMRVNRMGPRESG